MLWMVRFGGISPIVLALRTGFKNNASGTLVQHWMPVNLRGTIDYPCCGDFGLVDILLTAAQKLDRLDFREHAVQRATYLVTQAQKTGSYRLFANLPDTIFQPAFFQGAASIG